MHTSIRDGSERYLDSGPAAAAVALHDNNTLEADRREE